MILPDDTPDDVVAYINGLEDLVKRLTGELSLATQALDECRQAKLGLLGIDLGKGESWSAVACSQCLSKGIPCTHPFK